MDSFLKGVVYGLALLFSSWIVMLFMPIATGGAFTPGYWQTVAAEYIIGSIVGVASLAYLGVLDSYDGG